MPSEAEQIRQGKYSSCSGCKWRWKNGVLVLYVSKTLIFLENNNKKMGNFKKKTELFINFNNLIRVFTSSLKCTFLSVNRHVNIWVNRLKMPPFEEEVLKTSSKSFLAPQNKCSVLKEALAKRESCMGSTSCNDKTFTGLEEANREVEKYR